jgi:hypothetical protein
MELGESLPDSELLGKVSITFLRRKRVMPLRFDRDNRLLTVLMEDPTDREAIMDLEKTFKADVEPIMSRAGSVDDLLDELLGMWHSDREGLWGRIKEYL